MAWIESHQETGRHPKTKKLARLLGVSLPAVVGHLHYLWWWALDFAPDGVLDKFDNDDIAEAMEWTGDSDTLVDAMISCGYIDETNHGLMIHDWGEYAGKLLERRAKDRARKRAAAEAAGVPTEIRRKSSGKAEEGEKNPSDSLVTNQPTNSNQPTVTNSNSNQPTEPTGEPPAELEEPAADATPYKAIVALYHEICVSYSKLRNISDNRKRAIAARWKEYGHDLDTFRELFEMAEASAFLKGKNDRNWSADFNWLMNSENMAKVLEGKYADKDPTPPHMPPLPPKRSQQPEKFDTLACLAGMAGFADVEDEPVDLPY